MEYIVSGKIRIAGCATDVEMIPAYSTKYAVGDILYIMAKANKGKLERVTIKKIVITDATASLYIYKDTFNDIWQEFELITLAEAQQLVIEYVNYVDETFARLDNCVENLS